jgi:hypothetical protein
METTSKLKRIFRTVNSKIPDEQLWVDFWKDKTPEEKLNAAEIIIRGGDVTSRLQRVFRVIKRV